MLVVISAMRHRAMNENHALLYIRSLRSLHFCEGDATIIFLPMLDFTDINE